MSDVDHFDIFSSLKFESIRDPYHFLFNFKDL